MTKAARWPLPERVPFNGHAVDLEALGAEHVPELWDCADGADRSFDDLRYGPFASELRNQLEKQRVAAMLVVSKHKKMGNAPWQAFWTARPRS